MIASEMIAALANLIAEYGDLPVLGVQDHPSSGPPQPVFMPVHIERVQHWPINSGWILVRLKPGKPLT